MNNDSQIVVLTSWRMLIVSAGRLLYLTGVSIGYVSHVAEGIRANQTTSYGQKDALYLEEQCYLLRGVTTARHNGMPNGPHTTTTRVYLGRQSMPEQTT
jgi:hypothetical protein